MPYEPSFERTDAIDALCMEIAELVGMLSPQAPPVDQPDAASAAADPDDLLLARHRR